ncbi:MAG: peptidase S8 [Deltaproteobacteria bacterium]|nr:peptidase S8 [Deltaproteobacteria bacterium]
MFLRTTLLLAGALVFFCALVAPARGEEDVREIIIKFRPGIAEAAKASLAKTCGGRELRTFYRDHFRVLTLPAGAKMQAVLARLARHPAIMYAEPNYRVRAFSIPDDASYPLQWNFQLINMEAAWDISTGDGVTVAVLDSGISPYGDDGFGDRLLEGYNAFLNREGLWQDFHSHGTHVAGTIGQETNNNGTGVAGIAHSARLLPVKALNRYGYGSNATLAAGIRWAVDNGADIINMSLGSSRGGLALKEAVEYAHEQGVVLVAATGNDASADTLTPVSYPAAYEQVIAVGAVDSLKNRAFYSNGGEELDLVAPGGIPDDFNADGYSDAVMQETFKLYAGYPRRALDWGLYLMMGTSMASPHVAGVTALIKSLHPEWTPDHIRQALIATAVDLGEPGRDDHFGYGLVDAAAALAY